jgi:dipeptidyl aminopeptidase/acylaminoacyl peptidase
MEANIGERAGGDLDDWLAAAAWLRERPDVDGQRLAIMGRSAGGYATLLALGRAPDVFQVGVAISSPTHWVSYWEETQIPWTRRFRIKLMGLLSANLELYKRRSPIHYAADFRSPVLILHGESDAGVPCGQAREMAAELDRFGKTNELKTYAGEGHGFMGAEAVRDSTERTQRFLDTHLRGNA